MASFKVPELDLSRFPIPTQPFIDGKVVDSTAADKHTLVSTVNDAVVTTELQWCNSHDVDTAVQAAERGYIAWNGISAEQRRDALVNYAELIRENTERLGWLEAVSVGKASGFAGFEVALTVETFIYYANMIDKFTSEVIEHQEDSMVYTIRQPWGVTAGILPFNGPLFTFAMKVAPALASGNSIVIKASELNPLSTLFLASLAPEAGLPDGVINCLVGGAEVGNALATHMKIRKISFTGSIGTGRKVQVAAAQSNLKSVTMELGGKSPIVVFPDADQEKALQDALLFLALNGQGCSLGTRLYLHNSIADSFLEKLVAAVKSAGGQLGVDPTAPGNLSCPLFSHRQKEIVTDFIESGKKEATLVTGGSVLGDKGCYVEPTVFIDPQPNARVLKEEIFGPVLVVVRFETEEEVLVAANDTEYGLAAYIWTKDISRALRFSRGVEAGAVKVNGAGGLKAYIPVTPWKQSGQGVEGGKEPMLDWTQGKTVILG